ncbi:amino acid--[acyl-carrier-protein] ligase [Kineosporia mesophila]|uniref:Amino acid--[acyl-carrier-protein] ligase n=1 Tax=Kineosporia mesophila TaxID=566012 RepID=A0ABP6Z7L7_9ACTN|nr:hypothetical protein [Kineosporia mesophila]MCD5352973.1 hypothetical protein [Kineosporia mesophila]
MTATLTSAGLTWLPSGQAMLAGPLQQLFLECDTALAALAGDTGAEPAEHPVFLAVDDLERINYLASFPHLATFPVTLEESGLPAFAADPVDESGAVRLRGISPVRNVITPAACYHVYVQLRDQRIEGPRYLTFRNTCVRRETEYQPLRRQWSFRMREIVCLGSRAQVKAFLDRYRDLVSGLLIELGLEVSWQIATDPFFQPSRNPAYLAQRLNPTKHEAVFGGDLAIASVNLHEDHFGEAFSISTDEGPVSSGCVAFGLERWLYAITTRYGADPANWPDPVAAAGRVLERHR